MHICLITPSFPPMVDGGVAIATGRLVDSLLSQGHRLTVLTSPPSEPSPLLAATTSAPPRHADILPMFVEDPLRSPEGTRALCSLLEVKHKEEPFDVILGYFVYPGGYLATLLGERLNLPVICSCRGNDISKDTFIDPATIAGVLTRSTHLVFVSTSLLRMADTLVPCAAKATVVANAVDTTQFFPRTPPAAPRTAAVVVGTSGILRWKKGINLLFPLCTRLCADHPEVQVLLAGYGLDPAVDRDMTAFLHQHALQGRAEVTGAIPHTRMRQALQRMHLYVNTSYQEGMPNGVLEAMACALPVVATDADGTPELVQDGVTGYLCPMGDLDTLVDRCSRLIRSPGLRRRFGQAGLRRVQQDFRLDQEAATITSLLQRLCKTP